MWIEFKFPENSIEVRCPGKFNKLFFKLLQEHLPAPGTYMEIACADCAKDAKRAGVADVSRALHYYDTSGTCVHTKLVIEH